MWLFYTNSTMTLVDLEHEGIGSIVVHFPQSDTPHDLITDGLGSPANEGVDDLIIIGLRLCMLAEEQQQPKRLMTAILHVERAMPDYGVRTQI